MIKPIILTKGNFQPKDLITTVSESNRKIDPTRENQLETLWIEKERNAKEKGKLIYNGLSYRLNSLKAQNDKLFLDFGIFDFKTRECLPETQNYYETTEEYWRKGCHTLATVKTSDEKYLMVELSGKSMNKNPTDFLGGIMETEPAIKSGNDIFKSLYKELEEEAFILETDIAGSALKMVYINGNTNVGFYFEILLKITSEEMKERFDSQAKEIDIKSLKIMSRPEYINVLENHNPNKQFLATQIEI
ncbi:MAG: hypothetical protein FJZ43_04580 [Candidatus Staskawiczbacteria bacterium]|nr:hypothetical protein [Candidatus Staskawiczbacteria bacterium]